MQLIQTNDKANRQSFRDALQHKVEAALNTPPPSTPVVVDQILLVPSNFADLNSTDLHFSLMHNKELKHSRQSATLAVDILAGKATKPENVTFQAVDLANPVEIPRFASTKTVKRSAPRQLTPPDYTEEFKAYVQQFAAHTEAPKTASKPQQEVTILLPEGYKELSEDDLHYKLTHHTELAHSHESARFALDILHGRSQKPENVKFQAVELTKPAEAKSVAAQAPKLQTKIVQPREIEHRNKFKRSLADKAEKAFATKPAEVKDTTRTVLVPVGFKEMSAGELHFALLRNPEFKSSPEQTVVTVDQVTGRIGTPENVRFQVLEVDNLNLAPPVREPVKKTPFVAAPAKKAAVLARAAIRVGEAKEGERTILIPSNFESISETAMHFVLSHNREYGHSYESVYEALDILFGRKAQPKDIVFSTVEVKNPIERAY